MDLKALRNQINTVVPSTFLTDLLRVLYRMHGREFLENLLAQGGWVLTGSDVLSALDSYYAENFPTPSPCQTPPQSLAEIIRVIQRLSEEQPEGASHQIQCLCQLAIELSRHKQNRMK